MSRQLQARAGSFAEPRTSVSFRAAARLAGHLLLASFTGGCGPQLVTPFAGRDPSNRSAPVPIVSYHPTIGAFTDLRPVEPVAWTKPDGPTAPASKSKPKLDQ